MIIQLLAGMFLGTAVTSLVWGIVLNGLKKRSEKTRHERDTLMQSLGELWVEIEALVSSSGAEKGRSDSELRHRFAGRLEEVKRLLRPNLHLFDSYFVKYNEHLVAHYSRKVFGQDVDAAVATEAVANHEMETGLVHAEPEEVPLPPETDYAIEQPAEVTDKTVIETPPAAEMKVSPEKTEERVDESVAFEKKTTADVSTDVPIDLTRDSDREVTSETVLFKPSFDSEDTDDGIDEELFEASKAAPETKHDEPDVMTVPSPEASEPEPAVSPDATVSAEDEEVVFELKQPAAEDISSTVSAASEGDKRMFNEEEFSMETMVDVDISSLHSLLKPEQKDAASPESTEGAEPSSTDSPEEPKETDHQDLEVVIASGATHSDHSVIEEPSAAQLPEEPVFEAPVQEQKSDVESDDTIPDETVFARAEDLEKKMGDKKPKATISVHDDFEMMFQEGPVAVEQPSDSSGNKSVEGVGNGEELFEATLTDAESDLVTGNDVADKIAALEGSAAPGKKETKKEDGGAKDAQKPVATEKTMASSSKPKPKSRQTAKASQGKKSTVSSKRSARDDAITGDDVADKIDAFFGLFDE